MPTMKKFDARKLMERAGETVRRVGADGRVSSARASRNTTRSKTLGSCISGVFLSTVFPKPPDGAVTLRYPFHFAPRKK
jgi:hypothetical protein